MEATVEITPSQHARLLFSALVARAGNNKELTIEEAVELSNERVQRGFKDEEALRQLIAERWVAPSDDGGIRIIL